MAGHSKWANIKRRKAAVDEKRGAIFSKLAREITVAARQGGGNPDMNFRLKTAIMRARQFNLPMDNIQRAIARGTGEGDDAQYEELIYEGYGPGGAAVMLEIMTDNRNRTAAEIRHLFSRNGGNLGETGCVAWMFERRGVVTIEKSDAVSEDDLMMVALEAGADDVREEEEAWLVVCEPEQLEAVKNALDAAGIESADAAVTRLAQNETELTGEDAEKMMKLLDALDDHADVQQVHTNADF